MLSPANSLQTKKARVSNDGAPSGVGVDVIGSVCFFIDLELLPMTRLKMKAHLALTFCFRRLQDSQACAVLCLNSAGTLGLVIFAPVGILLKK